MKRLKDILNEVKAGRWEGPENPPVRAVCIDSREVEKESLFVAIPGTRKDGHDFIEPAIRAGAGVIVCEKLPGEIRNDVTYVVVDRAGRAAGLIAAAFYGHPSRKLKVVGITGTNGKTTVATLLYRIFMESGQPAGLLSTIQNRIGQEVREATHTTPDPIRLQLLLSEMVFAGCNFCFMEVSSHAIDQDRIAGIRFSGGVFTNITHEHLDYHRDFKAYLQAKKKFFDQLPSAAFAIVNVDDRNGNFMVQNCDAAIRRFSLSGVADFNGRVIESHLDGMLLRINKKELWSRLAGRFNALNLLAVYAVAVSLGMHEDDLLPLMSKQAAVRGRFEILRSEEGITVVIDYAHTPDALRNTMSAIHQASRGSGRLITVVGAGGERDAGKRPLMGTVAAEHSQELILTADNPRSEDPGQIISEMLDGVPERDRKRILSIPDRREAIRTAVVMAGPGDVILIAGKGHETYQETGGRRTPFDDREVIREFMDVKE